MTVFSQLFAQDNTGSFNREIAKVFGLNIAVYWAELTNIGTKAAKKDKVDEDGFITIDRNYIEQQTSLTEEEQYNCDTSLVKAEVMQVAKKNKDKVFIDVDRMISLVTNLTPGEITALKKKVKVSKITEAENRREGQASRMKQFIKESDAEILKAYYDWVDSIYANRKYLTKVIIEIFQNEVNSIKDKNIKLQVIKIATIHSYTDATWAVKDFYRNRKTTFFAGIPTTSQEETKKEPIKVKADITF